MLLLRNPIQPYAWGTVDGIAQLVGSEPTGEHEAELWVGTHPRGPSVVAAGEHEGRTLAEVDRRGSGPLARCRSGRGRAHRAARSC